MLDLVEELRKVVAGLDGRRIDYALCGGVAMGVYGQARATIDIDLLIREESLDDVLEIAKSLGYTIRGKDMTFANGAVEIRRVSKVDPDDGEVLSLDLLLVTTETQAVWESRLEADWEGRKLSVVTADGLIALKQLRSSAQDLADIEALTDEGSDETS